MRFHKTTNFGETVYDTDDGTYGGAFYKLRVYRVGKIWKLVGFESNGTARVLAEESRKADAVEIAHRRFF